MSKKDKKVEEPKVEVNPADEFNAKLQELMKDAEAKGVAFKVAHSPKYNMGFVTKPVETKE
jgi:hypothetical protein